ncbi:hypothetical protein BLA60_10140 [Actinophytocola xinjiangensis]|uniref:Uncharacterized protein n=1 Tax=Actinophytocola xinjiangensis TaxID=485602 RepID=A0A7Z0WQU3_9PSEU|nr:hypothetical protein BLA60_10140 [Actinophytocola xinjiangensis]
MSERSALFTLWVQNRDIPNPELTKTLGVDLRPAARDRLNKAGLIESTKGRPIVHRITPEGVDWCLRQSLTIEPPPRSGALVRAVFAKFRQDAPELTPDLEKLIREVYRELSIKPQDWVRLARIRPELNGADHTEVDETLLTMIKTGTVHLAPQSDRKALTDEDHAAAIRVGSQDKHLLAIEES